MKNLRSSMNRMFDHMDKAFEAFDKVFDEVEDMPVTAGTKKKTTIRLSLTRQQLMDVIITGKPIRFKVGDEYAISVEMKP